MLKALTRFREGIAAGYAVKSRVTASSEVGWRALGGLSTGILPGAKRDYAKDAGNLWENAVCMSCISWVQRAFTEARLQVLEKDKEGEEQEVIDHPLTFLLANPNANYTGRALWYVTLLSYAVDGNAYWHKVRNGGGQVIELRALSHAHIRARWPANDPTVFISHYEYQDGRRRVPIPAEDIVHFRWGQDPLNPRYGLAPWRAALREIDFDNRASTYTSAVIRNGGAPSVLIAPGSDAVEITEETRKDLQRQWAERYGGEQSGVPLVAMATVKLDKINWSPQEMALGSIRELPEARICSLVGVAPMVIGLSVGEKQRSYANLKESYEQSIEGCILPLQAMMSETMDQQLLPEFEGKERGRRRVGFDVSQVRALAPDMTQLRRDAALLFQAGIVTRAQALALVREQYDEAKDSVYIFDVQAPAQAGPGEGDLSEEEAKALLEGAGFPFEGKYNPGQRRDAHGRWTSGGYLAGGTLYAFHAAGEAERKERRVPPAWADVRVADAAESPLQVIGKDTKGRVQRVYSAEHVGRQAAAKFARLRALDTEVDVLKSRIDKDALGGPHKEEASALRLVALTGLRIGSDADTGAKVQAFGASTLRKEHVRIEGDTVHLSFVGKKGVSINKSVTDAQLARDLEVRRASGRDRLFETSDSRVREYLHGIDGEFKVKDFRTWQGTAMALQTIGSMPVPKTGKEYASARLQVARAVATHLGNTPAVALGSYISPQVFQAWEQAVEA